MSLFRNTAKKEKLKTNTINIAYLLTA